MRFGLLVVLAVAAACVRDEAAPICADVAVGELVITEIHGDADKLPWVEVYNASGKPVELDGTRVLFKKTDGTAEIDTLVRHPLAIAPGAYAVLGYVADEARPSFVDYGFAGDWHGAPWLASAAVDVEVCGTRIDRAQYSALPATGTYSLGATPPTATINDITASWCRDPAGTPQQANPSCP